jgi:small subunit ribosomal protein S20
MAVRHPSAQKRARQALKRRSRNRKDKDLIKVATKAVLAATPDSAIETYRKATKVIDRLQVKGIIKSNTAARRKSQLAKAINAKKPAG